MEQDSATVTIEFSCDGSFRAWPIGDARFLRNSLRNLAGALLTEPTTLDLVSGALGIPESETF